MPETLFIPQNRSNWLVFPIAPNVSFHNIAAFIIPVLLTLLQLKYKRNASDSPFEEHPVTAWFATGCLLVYCLVYAVELAEISGNAQANTIFDDRLKFLLGSLSIASLASMIFSRSFQPFLYGICIIVLVDQQLLFNTIEMFNLVYVSIRRFLRTAMGDRGGILPVALGNMPETRFIPQNRSNLLVFPIAPNVSFHNIVAFIVPVLLTLLQLKYKRNASDSPFEEHPVTVWFATGCLLVYCLVYAVELVEISGNAQVNTIFVDRLKFLLGSLSIASLASMMFPSSFQPFLYGICIIVLVNRQLLFNTIEMFNLVYVSIRRFLRTAMGDRGGILPVSIQQVWTHWEHPIHVNSD